MQYKHFTIEERESIQKGLWEGKSIHSIAQQLNRSPSSISREITRNLPPEHFLYTPRLSHARALKKRKSRGRLDRLKSNIICSYVVTHLKLKWSPEQIAGRITKDIPGASISHEAIYQYVYRQIHREGYGYLKPGCQDLRMCLRRRKKRRTHKGQRRCQRIFKPKGTSINERPLIINKRERLGDWEGDTVESSGYKPGINTLVERRTGLVLASKLKDKTGQATLNVVTNRLSVFPKEARHTLTMDNGSENSEWQAMEENTGIKCFFCNPYHSWERGTNENTNGLIRDYFPKKTDFTTISEEQVKEVEYLLNTRPRKRLGWLTPQEALALHLGVEFSRADVDRLYNICYTIPT